MTVKHLYLAFFSVFSIMLCSFILIIYGQYTRVQNLTGYVAYQYNNISQSRIILTDSVDMETSVRGYMLTADPAFLDPYLKANQNLREKVLALRNATYYEPDAFAETNAWLDEISRLQTDYESEIALIKAKGRDAVSIQTVNTQKSTMDRLRKLVQDSIDKRLKSLEPRIKAAEAQKSNFIYILAFGAIIGVGILLGGTITILKLETENDVIEEERERAESRFKTVMNGVNDGLYELNFVNETLYMSENFKAMLGYGPDELDDDVRTIIQMIHPDDLEHTMEVRRRYVTKEVPVYNNVFRLRHRDGTWRWVMSRGIGTWDKFGQIRSLIGTHTDITEQKNREEDLRQLNADMEAFTYITSHDMRSPLVNLKGFSHELKLTIEDIKALLTPQAKKLGAETWAKIDHALTTDIPEALGFIGNAVDRMDTLTTAILDLSRIGKFTYRSEPVDAQAIIDKCLGAQSFEINTKGVEVRVEPLPTLITDPLAIEQIFSNLLDNAVKYLDPERPGRLEIGCLETSRDYIFSFQDNGRGIEAEDNDRVFHIFRRARNTGDVRGLGLGMAFVKATLRKISGAIWFESQLDTGTTFYVSIPKKLAGAMPDSRHSQPEEEHNA